MIPEPKQDNTVLILAGLIVIVIIAIGAYILLNSGEQSEEQDDLWVADEGEVLSPNTAAVVILPEECPECNSSVLLLENLKGDWASIGTNITETKVVYDSSEEGRNRIIKYKIEKLPALILSKEGQWDSRILSPWLEDIGTVEDDGSLVQRRIVPPYYDLENKITRGNIEIIFITDKTCEKCYDVRAFADDMVKIFRLNVVKASEYDVSSAEGSAIVSKYGIREVPTFIVSEDVSVYSGFDEFWFAHDSIPEDDGWYVFRDVKYLGVEYVIVNETAG